MSKSVTGKKTANVSQLELKEGNLTEKKIRNDAHPKRKESSEKTIDVPKDVSLDVQTNPIKQKRKAVKNASPQDISVLSTTILYGSHDSVQAIMCGDTALKSSLEEGPYRIFLYPASVGDEVIDIFDVEKIECDAKQFEVAKSKIINSSLGDIVSLEGIFHINQDVSITVERSEHVALQSLNVENRARHDKVNGMKFSWIFTNHELGSSMHNWRFVDNVSECVLSFFRKLYPRLLIDEETMVDLNRKFSESRANFEYLKIWEHKPREDMLWALLTAISNAIEGNVHGDPLAKFAELALDSEFDTKKVSNSRYISDLFEKAETENGSSEYFLIIRKISEKIHREWWFTDFNDAKNPGPKALNELILKRLLYGLLYWFSWMQGDLKTKLFSFAPKEEISRYFWSDWGGELALSYREREGEGVGSFWNCVRLSRKIDWNVSDHYSDDLPGIAKDTLFQKEMLAIKNAALELELEKMRTHKEQALAELNKVKDGNAAREKTHQEMLGLLEQIKLNVRDFEKRLEEEGIHK